MKIEVKHIGNYKKFDVSGQEKWLEAIYKFFPTGNKDPHPTLTAQIEVSYVEDLFAYSVKYQLDYSPKVDCSRCGIKIDWPLQLSDEVYYYAQPDRSQEVDIIDLDTQDLDTYYVEDGQIDLESLLNDVVQLAIPSQTVPPKKASSDDCCTCGDDLSKTKVFGPKPEDDASNPFNVLKQLKKPLQ